MRFEPATSWSQWILFSLLYCCCCPQFTTYFLKICASYDACVKFWGKMESTNLNFQKNCQNLSKCFNLQQNFPLSEKNRSCQNQRVMTDCSIRGPFNKVSTSCWFTFSTWPSNNNCFWFDTHTLTCATSWKYFVFFSTAHECGLV